MSHKAILLAAGLGTRMRPLTDHMPKPLVNVAGKALVDHALDWFAAAGIDEVVVNSHYKAEMLETHLAQRKAPPKICISREEELLETGGGIHQALPLLGDEPFFSANSDVMCIDGERPALHRLREHWDDSVMDVLLLLHPVEKAVGYDGVGDFFMNGQGHLRRRDPEEEAPLVFTGVQMIHPRLFVDAPEGAFSLNVLYNRALEVGDGQTPRLHAIVHDGNWLHIGDPQGLEQAQAWLQAR
jgi:MurNAc alpha-1-phosphate uridylyltransferase